MKKRGNREEMGEHICHIKHIAAVQHLESLALT